MLPPVETFLQKCYHLWKHFCRNVTTCGNIFAEMLPSVETFLLKCYYLWKHFCKNVTTCGNISAEMYPPVVTFQQKCIHRWKQKRWKEQTLWKLGTCQDLGSRESPILCYYVIFSELANQHLINFVIVRLKEPHRGKKLKYHLQDDPKIYIFGNYKSQFIAIATDVTVTVWLQSFSFSEQQ
jgi:hypothetical protein